MVRELAMSVSLAVKNGYRLDWTGTWELETDTPFYPPDDPAPLRVLISFELPAPVRVERLLTLGLGLSRAEVRRMVADGRIRMPLALDAKARQAFEFTVDGDRPHDRRQASEPTRQLCDGSPIMIISSAGPAGRSRAGCPHCL
jgi:hypothetical protein